jgi:hypothetical protein
MLRVRTSDVIRNRKQSAIATGFNLILRNWVVCTYEGYNEKGDLHFRSKNCGYGSRRNFSCNNHFNSMRIAYFTCSLVSIPLLVRLCCRTRKNLRNRNLTIIEFTNHKNGKLHNKGNNSKVLKIVRLVSKIIG